MGPGEVLLWSPRGDEPPRKARRAQPRRRTRPCAPRRKLRRGALGVDDDLGALPGCGLEGSHERAASVGVDHEAGVETDLCSRQRPEALDAMLPADESTPANMRCLVLLNTRSPGIGNGLTYDAREDVRAETKHKMCLENPKRMYPVASH